MNSSRQFFLGLVAVALQAGLAVAQAPEAPGTLAPLPPATSGTADVAPPVLTPGEISSPTGGAAPSDRSGVISGVGLYLIEPYFQNNPAYTVFFEKTFNTVLNPADPHTQTLGEGADRVNVHQHLAVAPLVWLGYINEDGFGGRARWWSYRQGTSQTMNLAPFAGTFSSTTPPPPGQTVIVSTGTLYTVTSATPLGLQAFGDTLGLQHGAEATALTVTTELSLQVIDLELLQDFRAGGCNFLFAAGLRLASLDQTYNAYDFQSASAAELRTLLSSYNFKGLGPTVALETRRPLGESGLSLYGSARGALVFGSADQDASFGGQELRNNDPNPQFANQHRDRAIPVGEMEVGVEYGQAVGHSWLFGQVALVGQEWFGAGNASRSSMATVANTLRPVIGGAAVDSNIAFLGLSIRLGLEY
jgi:hypothetical protein